MKKAIGSRKSLLVCMLQLQEALESGGEDIGVGVCVIVYRVRVREELIVVHNTISWSIKTFHPLIKGSK